MQAEPKYSRKFWWAICLTWQPTSEWWLGEYLTEANFRIFRAIARDQFNACPE
jgi:hypothetical protein